MGSSVGLKGSDLGCKGSVYWDLGYMSFDFRSLEDVYCFYCPERVDYKD